MPYLLAHWCSVIDNPERKNAPETRRILRTVPKDDVHKEASGMTTSSVMLIKKVRMSQINIDVVSMTCDMVKQEIDSIAAIVPAMSTEEDSFNKFIIQNDKIVFSGYLSHIYEASCVDLPTELVMARVFEPKNQLKHSFWLKLVKHLGKRNKNLISTYGIYYDIKDRLVLLQEYAIYGNLKEHLFSTKTAIPETQVLEWAQQINRGLNFLGSVGICHRCICPKHLLMCRGANHEKVVLKLASFRDAIIYFDTKHYQVIHQPCRDLASRAKEGCFQAPEVFGNANEEYDPIVADVWSYGAAFFYAATLEYPYNIQTPPQDIELAIQTTIDLCTLSTDAVRWFGGLLKGHAEKRTQFDRIEHDPWYQTFS